MKLKSLVRSLVSEGLGVDLEKRTARFSFSSELPVERWFGKEILSHNPAAANLQRLNGGANVLWNHDEDQVIGVVTKAEIGPDKRGYCEMRFCEGPFADEKMRNMANGTLPNVSFRYVPSEMVLQKAADEGDEYLVTQWEALEVSSVSIPADPSVGLGRAKEDQEFEVRVINKKPKEGARAMDPIELKKQRDEAAEEARKTERARVAAITELGKRMKMEGLANELILGDKTVEEARAAFLEKSIGERQKPITGKEGLIGMEERDVKAYSFLRALNAMANPQDKVAQEAAGFERELSQAAAQKAKSQARGFMIPVDMLRAPAFDADQLRKYPELLRTLTVGTSTAGGDLVATNLLASSFIELLRNKAVLIQAGAQMLNGLVGNIAIPKLTGASTAYWVAEGSAPTAGNQTVGQVTMAPKSLSAYTDISRQLLMQSSIDVEMMVRNDIARIIALELDRVGYYGTGTSNQPLGIKNVSGISTLDLAGDDPTWAEIVSMETKLAAANADLGNMAYITNATRRGGMKTTAKASNYPVFVWGDDGMVNGYRGLVSNQVAAGDIFFANWNDLIFGLWSGLDMLVDPYSLSTAGAVRMTAFQSVDVAVRHAESFCRADNTL